MPDQVDDALALIDAGDLVDRSPVALVLAAEVRALRAAFARVEQLPDRWRDPKLKWVGEHPGNGLDCAADLERALRGEP